MNDNTKCCGNTGADYLVCTCMGLMQSEICTAIKNGCDSFEKLSESLMVGTGCSNCVAEVEDIVKRCTKKE